MISILILTETLTYLTVNISTQRNTIFKEYAVILTSDKKKAGFTTKKFSDHF